MLTNEYITQQFYIIRNGTVCTPREKQGVNTLSMFPLLQLNQFIYPILYLEIGLVNLVLDTLTEDLQVAMEEYTEEILLLRKLTDSKA